MDNLKIDPNPYSPTSDDVARLNNNFTYHTPLPGQPERYQILREAALNLSVLMHTCCPPSRERSIALTELETAVMWANAAIARNEKPAQKE